MANTLTLLANGRVTLGDELLDHLGVRPGGKLELEMLPEGRLSLRAAENRVRRKPRKQTPPDQMDGS